MLHYHQIQELTTHRRHWHDPAQPFQSLSVIWLEIEPSKSPPAEKLCEALHATVTTWEASDHFAQLNAVLATVAPPRTVNKVIAFALGSLSWDAQPSAQTILQHAFLLALGKSLAPHDGRLLTCYAQDPAYTTEDKEVLAGEGISILYDPQGFIDVDDDTILLSIAPNVPVSQIVADIARPAVIVWERDSVEYPW